ncbi:hypothetical protein ATANTOWER_001237, partial [Ataeniobius toweri]|nr:hypothetical protein [Ataeniobius toweri]
MRGEHEVELLGLSGSALSAAVSHLRHTATAPTETMTRASLMVRYQRDQGEVLQGGKVGRKEGDNAEEEWRIERMMDGVRTSLSFRHVAHPLTILRIPEGQSEAGSLAAGRLRSLEDQLTRAKQKIHSFQKLTGDAPGPTQEELRRKVENGIKEFWYFVRSEVKKLSNVEPSERQKYADTLLQDLGHQERSIMTDLYYLSQADGVGEWRMKEAKDLSDLVQNRITYLQ